MSDVYFFPASGRKETIKALERMYGKVSGNFGVKGKKVAVKVHFGEEGNRSYVDPSFVERICDIVRERGGEPELVECNTLYRRERMRTEDHLKIAKKHGFDFAKVVICDSVKGDWEIPVKGRHFSKVRMGPLLKDYDMMISLAHSKGHVAAGYGGAIKNVGMGLATRAGKLEMHARVRPIFNHSLCRACGKCVEECPADAIRLEKYAVMDPEKCIGCATCIAVCPYGAVEIPWFNVKGDEFQERVVEYANGVVSRIPTIYFNFLLKINTHCDCRSEVGKRLAKDVGVLASTDIVSIEQASIDMITEKAGKDVFREAHGIDVSVQPAYAEALGMGERGYSINTV